MAIDDLIFLEILQGFRSDKDYEMAKKTFYWHDYETFGIDPSRDRPVQFAGIRTDENLNIIGQPLDIVAKPANDFLPNPQACLVTGITPQQALEKGMPESEFIKIIHQELSTPNTCTVGYNNLRFDDEFTRFSFFRNFYDPYAREWQNGNSRWDLIDVVRITHALRPKGINWPINDEGRVSFRLEELSQANGISHQHAHDALSDVYATIALGQLIKKAQPRLFDFCLGLSNKHKVAELLSLSNPKPLLHVSGMYPSQYGHCALVYPLMAHPTNKNGIIVYDLRHNPAVLADLSADEISERLYTSSIELQEKGLERVALKTVHLNKCPALAPISTLDEQTAQRLEMDLNEHKRHMLILQESSGLFPKLEIVFQGKFDNKEKVDPDQSLYKGGFLSRNDKEKCQTITQLSREQLMAYEANFSEPRLDELLFRYKARNYPELLNNEEKHAWDKYRFHRLTHEDGQASIKLDEYQQELNHLEQEELTPRAKEIVDKLKHYPQLIGLDAVGPDEN